MKQILIVWVVVILMASHEAKHVHNRTDIYFAAFFPMTPPHSSEGLIGHGVMPAVRLAIKHINQSPSILKGYKLHMYWNDTQVRRCQTTYYQSVVMLRLSAMAMSSDGILMDPVVVFIMYIIDVCTLLPSSPQCAERILNEIMKPISKTLTE